MSQTNEYINCLISAGFVRAEDLDNDYQEYLKNIKHKDVEEMSYSDWQSAIKRMEELDQFYKRNIEPLYFPTVQVTTYEQTELESHYWSEVSAMEYALGY